MRLHESLHDTAFSDNAAASHEGIDTPFLVTMMEVFVQQCLFSSVSLEIQTRVRAQNTDKRQDDISQEAKRQDWSSRESRRRMGKWGSCRLHTC